MAVLPILGCGGPTAAPRFDLLDPDRTGITFANTITTTDSVNVQTDSFIYNGGGVAAGDVDGDGLVDLYLTGNMVSSRLYLNRGDLRFEDITGTAGVGTERWATGASLVDIDADGDLDLYVSVSGPDWTPEEDRANLLFVNNGDLTFTEAAAAAGLDDTGFTTHTAFFDYDLDGDLDAFLLSNAPGDFARGEAERHPAGVRSESATSFDRLYRKWGGVTSPRGSLEAGILQEVGFGLGVVVSDLNEDGWPDVYVSNDDTPNDVLYVNNGDGTFSDRSADWLQHTSFAGMGIDIADFNNDGWVDILQTDMMPEDLEARKRMTGSSTYTDFMENRRRGFTPDYNANALQLNNGVLPDGEVRFSEMARMAGVAYTDWSWTVLFGDYDNDGLKDILVTNGYPKAVIDFDYQIRMHGVRAPEDKMRRLEILDALHTYDVSNYLYRNRGDLTFADETEAWGADQPAFSYGAVHADLDNDGRLDLVVNNIDAPAFVYHNRPPAADSSHYLQVALEGDAPNLRGVGAKVRIVAGGRTQYVYHTPYRGFMSSMEQGVHFGLGDAAAVDTLQVTWPDGRAQVLTAVGADAVVRVRQADATGPSGPVAVSPVGDPVFTPVGGDRALRYEHEEKALVDFSVQPLLPHLLSRQGPPLVVGDVTGNGLDDVYVGGVSGVPGRLFLQGEDGRFTESDERQPWADDERYEDWGGLFFDADGDGWLDLYVASGGYHSAPTSAVLQDRLYRNRGDGTFVRDSLALPEMATSTASVTAADFTGDGRPDLFVGGRLVPRNYPLPTRSYLLRNDGGRFTDVTATAGPELIEPGGMVTDGAWLDWNADGQPDLVTAGTWMPLRFYENEGGQLREVTDGVGLSGTRGWWYRLASGDFNGDGRPDLVAGNLGSNYSFTTSAESRFGVFAADLTGNRTTDIVFTQEIDGVEYPYFGLAKMGREIFTVASRFSTHESFAAAPVELVFGVSTPDSAVHYQADTFASLYLENRGDGTFSAVPLPSRAQISPVNAIVVRDIDRDGHLDLVVAGNQLYAEPNTPRADAGLGLWLRGDGRGGFAPVPPRVSGLVAPLQVVDLAVIGTPSGSALLVANNADSLQTFAIRDR